MHVAKPVDPDELAIVGTLVRPAAGPGVAASVSIICRRGLRL
jgi:hypothetical protein